MKRLSATLALALLLLFLSGCQTASLRSAGSKVNAYPALWLAEKGDSKVYLFGSIHLLPQGVRWYTPAIASAFEGADELVIESKSSDAADKQLLSYVQKRALLPDGQTLDELMKPADYAKIMELAKVLNLDRYKVSRMQPWFLRIVLANELFEQTGMRRKLGVDTLFEQTAERRKIKISALETPQEAMMTLANYPLDVQLKQLSDAFSDKPENEQKNDDFGGLLISWAVGDVDRNARLIARGMTPLTYQNVVVNRNRKWLPRVESYLQKRQQTMVVVGNAHLVGRENIIDMLKRRGHKVTRIQ